MPVLFILVVEVAITPYPCVYSYVEFMYEFWFDLISDYEQMIVEYNQSQRNAASSDLSPQLKKMNWLMETVKTTSQSSSRVPGKKELGLEYRLRKIKDKQCI